MNIGSISSKNIEEGEKKIGVRQKYRGRGGGKSGRSKYRQIAMLSAMATGSTTCQGRDAIKVKCLQRWNSNICNASGILSP